MAAARQRRGRPRQSISTSVPASSYSDRPILTSRRTLLVSLLIFTTAIFFSLQISRYQNENSATGRFLNSVLKYPSKSSVTSTSTRRISTVRQEGEESNVAERLSALARHFQKEIGAFVADPGGTNAADKLRNEHRPNEGVAVVPGEKSMDHTVPPLLSKEHLPEKSREEAAQDQEIGLEDLDEGTLKAMFDALYARS